MYKQTHFHFVGINGIGMSGIAKILHQQGHIVSGCDLAQQHINIQELIQAGCHVSHMHNSAICHDPSIDIVVYSSDIPYHNIELTRARSQGIKIVPRAAILAELMRMKYSIAVAGSHGKTTTSSLIGHILQYANIDPTIIVGGIMLNISNNAYYGKGIFMVAETDESDRSHLLLPSSLSILTNIDFEHANIYKNIEDVQQTFLTFLQKLPFYGKAILCIDDPNITTLIPQLTSSYLTYGTTNQADIQATHIQLHENSSLCTIIDHRHHITYKPITIPLPSIYNVLNATAAICTALEVGIPFETIAQAIETFQGVDRRFIFKGTIPTLNVDIFDDYGHHPTEIYHSLITARRKTKHKLIVVFQPQRYTRTYHLWDQFIQVFKDADIDHLIITDIYPSSEPAIEHITGKNLAQAIAQNHPQAVVHYIQYDAELKALSTYLTTIISPDDLILLLGAGKVNQLAEILLSKT